MSTTALIGLAAIAAQSPTSGGTDNPVTQGLSELFVQACIIGELRLKSDVGKPVLPAQLGFKPDYGNNKVLKAQYYEIVKPGPALLQITDWAPGHDRGWARSCILGSTKLDLNTSWKYVTRAAFGRESRNIPRARIYRLDVPASGYTLTVFGTSLRTVIYDQPTAEKMRVEWRRRGSKPASPVAEGSICVSEMLCG